MRPLAPFVASVLLLAGCYGMPEPGKLDPATGQFATKSTIPHNGVAVYGTFDPRYTALVYLKLVHDNENPYTFYVGSFEAMGTFKQVLTAGELQAQIHALDPASATPDVISPTGLSRATGAVGPFLIVEPGIARLGGMAIAQLKVSDAATGRVILKMTNNTIDWTGDPDDLNRKLFFPLFNGFLLWTKGQPIPTDD